MVLRPYKTRKGKDKNLFYKGKVPAVSFNTRKRCSYITVGAVQEACEALDDALETAMDTTMSLTDKYKETRDHGGNSKLCQETKKLEIELI